MQHFEYNTALIYSDSTITYHPEGGFQLTRGRVLFTQANRRESSSEEGISQNKIHITEINKLQQEKEKEQNKAFLNNKEKRFPSYMVFILLITLTIVLLYKRIQRALS